MENDILVNSMLRLFKHLNIGSLWIILSSVCLRCFCQLVSILCDTLITVGQLCFYIPPPHVAHGNSGGGSNLVPFQGQISTLEVCVLLETFGISGNQRATGLGSNFSPRLISPISFFFGPFPKLLLRDHEKKMPRFLSAPSSLPSSFSAPPELCFLVSY